MKYHAISRGPGQPTCPRCHQPELAYRAEDGAGDRYQCLICGAVSVHLHVGRCVVQLLESETRPAPGMEIPEQFTTEYYFPPGCCGR